MLASLRALENLVKSSTLAASTSAPALTISTIAEGLFAPQQLISLSRIISQRSIGAGVSRPVIQSQITAVASLISSICREDRHQHAIASSGVLDALATRIAQYVVEDGLAVPGAETLAYTDGLQEHFPFPGRPNGSLAVILEAVAVIIADSKLRASQLLYSPSILAVFPKGQSTDFIINQHARAARNTFNPASLADRQNQPNALDFLLPSVPLHTHKSSSAQSSEFPPLGTSDSQVNLASNTRNGTNKYSSQAQTLNNAPVGADNEMPDPDEPESPFIAYLILLIRKRSSAFVERLAATSVLTVLYRAGLMNKTRETTIGLLVVRPLVKLLEDSPARSKGEDIFAEEEEQAEDWAIKEKAPAILAMLITDSKYLQKAAFDSGAIDSLSKLLKVAYDPVPESANSRFWSPRTEDGNSPEQSLRLGHEGDSPLLVHKIKVRESTLKAIASIVTFLDEYRKVIVDQGLIPYIVESMKSDPGKPSSKNSEKSDKTMNGTVEGDLKLGYGINPVDVIIAACGAVRALSRSVSILRTTLIDHGIAAPVIRLLRHPDMEIQIAATAATCNLVIDLSPMREVSYSKKPH